MASNLENRTMAILLFLFALFQLSNGAVYKVGDSAGWTTIGNVDYKLWAATKTFQVGDIIVFKYNPQLHNVMQVTHAQYRACNASSPIWTHTTGNDTITIDTHGHHFFVCGVPGHCQAGQKVDINVLRAPSVSSNPLGSSSPVPPVPPVTVTSPSTNDAAAQSAPNMHFGRLGRMLLILQLLLVLFFSSQ